MFMDLTILAHYSQIRQSAISLAELTSLTSFVEANFDDFLPNFRQVRYYMHF